MKIEHRIKGEPAAEPVKVIEWSVDKSWIGVHFRAGGEIVISIRDGAVYVLMSSLLREAGLTDKYGYLKIKGYTRNALLPKRDDTFFEAVREWYYNPGAVPLGSLLDAETARREKEKQA